MKTLIRIVFRYWIAVAGVALAYGADATFGSGLQTPTNRTDTGITGSKHPFSASLRSYYGILLAHRKQMSHLNRRNISGIEVGFSRQEYGDHPWEQLYGYPRTGLAVGVYDLGNPELLGKGYAVHGYVYFPLIRRSRFRFGYRCTSGAGWVEKPFDRVENFKNNSIGSNLNLFVQLLFEEEWLLGRRWSLLSGISITHFSNGAFRVPNLGINLVTLSAGLRYQLGESRSFLRDSLSPPSRAIYYSMDGGFCIKEISPPGGKKYPVVAASVNAFMPVARKRDIGAGIYVSHDASNLVTYNDDDSHAPEQRQMAFIRAGVHLSHGLNVGKLSAIAQFGVYLHTKLKNDGYLYHRLIYRYYLNKNLFIHLALKTHWAVADYMEWGVGWRFN